MKNKQTKQQISNYLELAQCHSA